MHSFITGLVRSLFVLLLIIFLALFSSPVYSQGKIGSNKHKEGSHNRLLAGMGFAFNYTSPGNAGFIEFSLTAPTSQTNLGTITGKNFYAADFNNFNQLFAIDGGTTGTSAFYRIDTANGSQVLIGTAVIETGQRMTGLTYDSVSGHWYACSNNGSTSILYIVNSTTGSLIYIGNIQGSPSVVSISASRGGTLFGIDNSTNNLIRINTLTALPTVIGSLGVTLTSYQGMDFNPATGILYLSANAPSPQLRTVDTTTGSSSLVGSITGTTLVTGLAIQFPNTNGAPPVNGLCEAFNSTVFPPAGWYTVVSSDEFWSWTQTTAYCLGNGSAEYDFFDATPGVTEKLITNVFSPPAGESDSLILQEAYATYQTEDDQLEILTSNDTGVTWTSLILLQGGVSGLLVTAPPTQDPFLPTCTQWQKLKYIIPAGTNRIQFHVISAFGNNLYIDSVCVKEQPIGITPITGNIPSTYYLSQNYPNPFNPSTNIKYQITKNSFVKIVVYNVLGEEVSMLVNENQKPGTYEVNWNAENFPSGVYFYKLIADDFTSTKKMILLK